MLMLRFLLVAPESSPSQGGHQSGHILEAYFKKDVQKYGRRLGQEFDTTSAVTFLAYSRGEADLSKEASFRIASRTNPLVTNNTHPS